LKKEEKKKEEKIELGFFSLSLSPEGGHVVYIYIYAIAEHKQHTGRHRLDVPY
jgi:hypothetical protein